MNEIILDHTAVGHNVHLTRMEDTTQLLVKDLAHGYPLAVDYNKIPIDYPIPPPSPPQTNGFHLISEVTNTLLGQ
ncbi:hypothetical protein RB195_007059 [Necator americanus]|uniref:Uncharacterized protein n=1 Tax=Necator americanus TaxID=51031 RepID=A0ABR1BYR5_NECAM